ncbi:31108_t:CDS:2 [Gigaspora margarita]|uniref:31108_t:CDS:1 n=1 Tax=Gigaspora margarita TaxID=4874 RepID=A0ABN7UU00_GIGMA|nr:31108_t:CDS:2 [Gigaspora margarita]
MKSVKNSLDLIEVCNDCKIYVNAGLRVIPQYHAIDMVGSKKAYRFMDLAQFQPFFQLLSLR